MNPQHDHYLHELGRLQIDQPKPSRHSHHEHERHNQPFNTRSRFGRFRNSTQFLSHLRKIRVQVTFEVAEPCPDGQVFTNTAWQK